MSVDTNPDPDAGTDADPTLANTTRFGRTPGITRGEVAHTTPLTHGIRATFHLQDHHRAPPENVPEYRNVPDGSLYQQCRVAWLTAPDELRETYEDRYGTEHEAVVLDDAPDFSTVPDATEPTAIVLTSSNYKAGTGDGDDYSPYYKYTLARRPINDDGEIQYNGSPKYTMTARIRPQYDHLVHQDGNALSLPYGEGTSVRARVNYAPTHGAVFARMQDLVREGLGYAMDYGDVLRSDDPDYFDVDADDLQHDGKADTNESRDLSRTEQYVRIHKSQMEEMQHTIQQSLDLIPSKGGRTQTIRSESDGEGRWLRYGFISQDWDLLGYPDLGDMEIGLKVYVDNPDAPAPFCHPKVEAWVAGTNGESLKWTPDDWAAINAVLREIVISHLHHAGIARHDLVADDEFVPAKRDETRAMHPTNRRKWLRNYYAELRSSVEHEARRTRTDLSRDILRALVYHGRDLTLSELADMTGAVKRTISERIRKMEQAGRDDEPGIVERSHSSECNVSMAREMRKYVRKVLDATHPGETWSDVQARAERRREDRRQNRTTADDETDESDGTNDADTADDALDSDDDSGERNSRSTAWQTLAATRLDGDDLATALDREFLSQHDVKVDTAVRPALFDTPG